MNPCNSSPFHTPNRPTLSFNKEPRKRTFEAACLQSFDPNIVSPFRLPESSFRLPNSTYLPDKLSGWGRLSLCLETVILASHTNQGVVLTVGGEMNVVEVQGGGDGMMTLLSCKFFQAVPCTEIPWQTQLCSNMSIWIDEEGMHTKQVNTLATLLFGDEVFSNIIHGDAFICVDGVFEWHEWLFLIDGGLAIVFFFCFCWLLFFTWIKFEWGDGFFYYRRTKTL